MEANNRAPRGAAMVGITKRVAVCHGIEGGEGRHCQRAPLCSVRAERNAIDDLLKLSPMSQKKEKKKRLPEQEKRKGTEQDA
jgi:hypothetical protein